MNRNALSDLNLAYLATQELLRARSPADAQAAVVTLCQDLGAEVIRAQDDDGSALHLDLSLGLGEPLVPVAPDPQLREALCRYLVPAVMNARSVAERVLSSGMLAESASQDALTGLWGRRSLMAAVNRMRPGDSLALLDLDHFKDVNDTLGHAEGDRILVKFGAHLRSSVRDRDIVGRLGGEEFVILFPATSISEACVVLERLRAAWREKDATAISFSGGVAKYPGLDSQELDAGQLAMKRADQLMYEAKSLGRDLIMADSD